MKIKNKGKVYPSPSSSSSATILERETDYFSVLKLLPAAILTLASLLSLEDREVLAYMITRSMKTTTNSSNPDPDPINSNSSSNPSSLSKKPSKKLSNLNTHFNSTHKVPIFDCDCFDCYTSYWFRWDSSPNRELIHQAIEAFEDHLSSGEKSIKHSRSKRMEKSGRRVSDKSVDGGSGRPEMVEMEAKDNENEEVSVVAAVSSSPDDDVSPERAADGEQIKESEGVNEVLLSPPAAEMEDAAVVVGSPTAMNNQKGLARTVLPDVLGKLNSRLWSLWGPNI